MVRIGLIGCGKWGMNHAKALFLMKDCEFVGIADIFPETERFAKQLKVKFFEHYQDLLPFVDAVSIVTPTDTHYRIVKDCIEARKHVIVEKPLTMNYIQASELVSLAKKEKVILATGYLFRFNNSVIKLKELVKKSGDISYITARYIHSTNPPRKDSGVVYNLGSHLVDIMNFLMDRPPERVFCKKVDHFSELEDFAEIILDYGKFVACLEVSWLHPLKKRDMWIIADKKKVYADLLEQTLDIHDISITMDKSENRGSEKIDVEKNEPLAEELKHFVECIKKVKEPINNGAEGALVTKICEKALESAKTGKWVAI